MDQMSCYAIDALPLSFFSVAFGSLTVFLDLQLNVKPMREAATSHIREWTDKKHGTD